MYLEVLEQVVNARLNVETVEPKRKDASLALSLGIKVLNHRLLSFLQRLKTWVGVEEVGDKREVELGVSSDHGRRREVFAATDAFCILKHLLRALEDVASL
jgi:hypothetical protein